MTILTNLELDNVIRRIPLSKDKYIVLVDTTENPAIQKKYNMKNIFCVNSFNEIIWQVSIKEENKIAMQDTFMYVELASDGSLKADTFFGIEYSIDIDSGNAIRVGWHK